MSKTTGAPRFTKGLFIYDFPVETNICFFVYIAEQNAETKEACYKCRICNKKFNRAERLSSHMTTHRGYDCTEPGCDKVRNPTNFIRLGFLHVCLPQCKKLY